MAAPFVEGRLRNEPLTVEIESSCAHCNEPIAIRVDSELRYESSAAPMIFEPRLDWSAFRDPNIINQY